MNLILKLKEGLKDLDQKEIEIPSEEELKARAAKAHSAALAFLERRLEGMAFAGAVLTPVPALTLGRSYCEATTLYVPFDYNIDPSSQNFRKVVLDTQIDIVTSVISEISSARERAKKYHPPPEIPVPIWRLIFIAIMKAKALRSLEESSVIDIEEIREAFSRYGLDYPKEKTLIDDPKRTTEETISNLLADSNTPEEFVKKILKNKVMLYFLGTTIINVLRKMIGEEGEKSPDGVTFIADSLENLSEFFSNYLNEISSALVPKDQRVRQKLDGALRSMIDSEGDFSPENDAVAKPESASYLRDLKEAFEASGGLASKIPGTLGSNADFEVAIVGRIPPNFLDLIRSSLIGEKTSRLGRLRFDFSSSKELWGMMVNWFSLGEFLVAVAIDTSGSMLVEAFDGKSVLQIALELLQGILDHLQATLIVGYGDVGIEKLEFISRLSDDHIVSGGGGTSLKRIAREMFEKLREIKRDGMPLLLITDGYDTLPTKSDVPKGSHLYVIILTDREKETKIEEKDERVTIVRIPFSELKARYKTVKRK